MKRLLLFPLLVVLAACSDDAEELKKTTPLPQTELRLQNDLMMARAAEGEGDVDRALMLYKRVAAKEPDNSEPLVRMAYLLRHKKRISEASSMLGKAAALEPDNTELLQEYAMSLVAVNNPSAAVPVFDRVLMQEPRLGAAYNGKGVALDLLKDHKAAQATYRKGLLAQPDSVGIANNLALSLILTDNYADAITLLEPLAEKADARATVRQNLALAYGLKGDHKKALAMGMKDLPEPKAKENLEYYKRYIVTRKQKAPSHKAAPVAPVKTDKKELPKIKEPEPEPDIIEEAPITDESLSPYEEEMPAEPVAKPVPIKQLEKVVIEEEDDDDGLFEKEEPATPVPSYRKQ